MNDKLINSNTINTRNNSFSISNERIVIVGSGIF